MPYVAEPDEKRIDLQMLSGDSLHDGGTIKFLLAPGANAEQIDVRLFDRLRSKRIFCQRIDENLKEVGGTRPRQGYGIQA